MVNVVDNPIAPKYNHVNRDDVPDFICIRIGEGEFEGIVYHYENLKIGDETEEGDALLHFNYHIVESFIAEEMLIDNLKNRLEDTIACILHDILIKQAGRIGNEDRTDDSEESSS
jgi:hypothetical protein